jgi:hypothetical protein
MLEFASDAQRDFVNLPLTTADEGFVSFVRQIKVALRYAGWVKAEGI